VDGWARAPLNHAAGLPVTPNAAANLLPLSGNMISFENPLLADSQTSTPDSTAFTLTETSIMRALVSRRGGGGGGVPYTFTRPSLPPQVSGLAHSGIQSKLQVRRKTGTSMCVLYESDAWRQMQVVVFELPAGSYLFYVGCKAGGSTRCVAVVVDV
jgi:hypothetical protein